MRPILLLMTILLQMPSFAQTGTPPEIEWQNCYGGSGSEAANCIRQTTDGGYIFAGYSTSSNGDLTGNFGGNDFFVVKIDNKGVIKWQKNLGGAGDDVATAIRQTTDGGYIVAGYTDSTDGDVTGNHGGYDYWIVKLNEKGIIQWQKCFGGTGDDKANDIIETDDSGYIVAGYSNSNSGDVSGNHGGADCWIVKLNDTGGIQWKHSYGGTNYEDAKSIRQTYEGGYIVTGVTSSRNGDVTSVKGAGDYWVVKLSDTGLLQWQKTYGFGQYDVGYCVEQTTDSGYIVSGHRGTGPPAGNGWVVKISDTGAEQWAKVYQQGPGQGPVQVLNSVIQVPDGGYIFAGYGGYDYSYVFRVIKTDDTGAIQWVKLMGGPSDDLAYCVQPTNDGGYIAAGMTWSYTGDITGQHSTTTSDCWIVKLGSTLDVKTDQTDKRISIVPNPTNGDIFIKGSGVVHIIVTNIMGSVLKNEYHTDVISLSEFPTGMYFIRLFDESGAMIRSDKIIRR